MDSNIKKFTGFDKAAILLHLLGDSLALILFNTISEADMLKIELDQENYKIYLPL